MIKTINELVQNMEKKNVKDIIEYLKISKFYFVFL